MAISLNLSVAQVAQLQLDAEIGHGPTINGIAAELAYNEIRQHYTANVYCPNGRGGGKDPSCKKESSGTEPFYYGESGTVMLHRNPSSTQALKLLEKHKVMRGLYDSTSKNYYLFDALKATHDEISQGLDLDDASIQRGLWSLKDPYSKRTATPKVTKETNSNLKAVVLRWAKGKTAPEAKTGEEVTTGFFVGNAFCPTGPGGGRDNSCSGRSSGTEEIELQDLTTVRLNRNPSGAQAKALLENYGAVRGLMDRASGDIYLWEAGKAIHYDVAKTLNIKYENTETWTWDNSFNNKFGADAKTGYTNKKDIAGEKKLQDQMVKQLQEWRAWHDKLTKNVFCPNGPGGGVDPTCSPGGSSTNLPSFKKWFSDSKVVDENGKPRVVYHGTIRDFESFQTNLPDDKDWGMLDRALGAHFAEDPTVTDTFTQGQYVWPSSDNASDKPGESWYKDSNGELKFDGIPILISKDEHGNETVEPYDPKVHGGTWGVRDRLGRDAYLRVLPPGGKVLPVYLSIKNPLVVEPIDRESDQAAVSRVVGAIAFKEDRALFMEAIGSTGHRAEVGAEIWDTLSAGKEYKNGEYEKYKDFNDVAKNFPGMLNGRDNALRAKEILREKGYDGIRYTNTSTNEVKGEASNATWIAFEASQIKSAIGNKGTFAADDSNIRNAWCPTGKGGGKDNSCSPTGSTAFANWFQQSQVIDKDGKPLVVYHGTNADFDEFSYDKIGTHGTSEGRGFYFTDSQSVAGNYGSGEDGSNVKPVYLSIQKPLSGTEKTMTEQQLMKFIKRLDPNGDGYLSNWGDVESEGYQKVLRTAVRSEWSSATNDVDMVNGIIGADGGASKRVFTALTKATGYDGIVERAAWGGQNIYIPFHPSQIKSAIGNKGTFDPKSPNITNAWCPTGPGGGKDNSCGRDGFETVWPEGSKGKAILIRGGDISEEGPVFATTYISIGEGYSKGRSLLRLEVDKKHLLIVGSNYWRKYVPAEIRAVIEDGPDLYTDPPENLLQWMKGVGFGGLASIGGDLIRIEDRKIIKDVKTITDNVATSGKFSSTQVNIEEPLKGQIVDWIKSITLESDLAEDGIETDSHITVKYGLHTDDADAVCRLIENLPPIRATLGKTSIFEVSKSDGRRFDVVKIDIDSDDLHRFNKIISDSLEHTDTFPNYHPHLTLAYVKAGHGPRYAGLTRFEGTELVFDWLTYSSKQQEHTDIDLCGTYAMNAFCPTGKGNGQDNSCSPNGGNSLPIMSALHNGKHVWELTEDEYIDAISPGQADMDHSVSVIDDDSDAEWEDSVFRVSDFRNLKQVADFEDKNENDYVVLKSKDGSQFFVYSVTDIADVDDGSKDAEDVVPVAYIYHIDSSRQMAEDATSLAVRPSYQGLGIGTELAYQYRIRHPFAFSGGLSKGGEATERKVHQRMVHEFANTLVTNSQRYWYPQTDSTILVYGRLKNITANVYCPTGEGGGKDNSCGREGGGGSPVSVSEHRNSVLGHKDGKEYLVLTDHAGKVIGTSAGEGESVSNPKTDRLSDPSENLINHHNHPYDSPPSMADVLQLGTHVGLRSVYAHSEEATYHIKAIGDRRELYHAAKDEYGEARIKVIDKMLDGESMSREEVHRQTADIALKSLSDKGLIEYKVTKHK